MVDLHSHALFGMDDGAQSIDQSLAILREAVRCGINKMALTPHFTVGGDVEAFLRERDHRIRELKNAAAAEEINIELTAGAEVYITDDVFECEDIGKLTIGSGNVLLAEFKYHGLDAATLMEYIDEIQNRGAVVLVAHPERYSYLRRNSLLVNSILMRGALLQINCISLFESSEEGDFARMLLRRGAAKVLASDVHHPTSRRMAAMAKLTGPSYKAADAVAEMIFTGDKRIADVEAQLL